jgi:hypothetical protein
VREEKKCGGAELKTGWPAVLCIAKAQCSGLWNVVDEVLCAWREQWCLPAGGRLQVGLWRWVAAAVVDIKT